MHNFLWRGKERHTTCVKQNNYILLECKNKDMSIYGIDVKVVLMVPKFYFHVVWAANSLRY